MLFSSLLTVFTMISSPALAAAPISQVVLDLSKPTEVHISPGRISVLSMPEPIAEAKVGSPSHLKAVLSTTDQNEVTLFWVAPRPYTTNLIVRTTKRVFVFEILPTLNRHQDYLKVRGAFGGPSTASASLTNIIAEAKLEPRRQPLFKSKVVSEGKLQ